jgi:hypothetical protein
MPPGLRPREYLRGIGSKGGTARRENLTKQERTDAASEAATARWDGVSAAARKAHARALALKR